MSKCDIKVEKNGQTYKVTVVGVIDEDIDFASFGLSGASQLDFYLAGVKSINSCGIREWIKWLSSGDGAVVIYHECPKIIVDQINMVQGFLPTKGRVMSFYVPYYNDSSGDEMNVLFQFGKEFTDSEVKAPAGVKDSSGAEMEMDVVESKYFKFLKKS